MSKYINPFPQHFDSNGDPLASYTVYFGEPNQDPKLFPKAPYSDKARSIPLPTNIDLDPSGSYGIDVFLKGSYSIRVETPVGSLWRESPEVAGASLSLLVDGHTVSSMEADAALVIGDFVTTVGYTSSGDGGDNTYEIVAAATGTHDGGSYIDLAGSGFQAKGLFPKGVHTFQQWGAVGDGVTDDTAAINAALNSGSKRIIFTDTGSPYLLSNIVITGDGSYRSGLIVEGSNNTESGNQGSYLLFSSLTETAIDIQAGDVCLKHIRASSTGARAGSGSSPAGIHVRGDLPTLTLPAVVLDDVWVHSQPGNGMVIEGAEHARLVNCNSNSNGGVGYYVKSAGGGGVGISNTFTNCRAYNNALSGWDIESWFCTFISCQSLANNTSSTLYAGSSYEVDVSNQSNVFISFDVESQAQHSGTAGVDRPTTMNGWRFSGRNNSVIGGICAGFSTGFLITADGDHTSIKNTNINNQVSGGNMDYGVDNSALDNCYIDLTNTGGGTVTTLVRNKRITGWIETSLYVGSGLFLSGDPEEIVGPGAISPSTNITHIETTGTDAFTLSSPDNLGAVKYIIMKVDAGAGTLTPTTLQNGTTITFNSVGDSAHLLFTGSGWHFMGGTATLA